MRDVNYSQLWQHLDRLPTLQSQHILVQDNYKNALISKNENKPTAIASITKLMTALVILRSGLPLETKLTITNDDIDHLKHSSSRLKVGETFSRLNLLRLSLMSSDNRAAHALARTFPGGTEHFIKAMNVTAQELALYNTQFSDPTGLSPDNISSAKDIAEILYRTDIHPLIRQLTTTKTFRLNDGKRTRQYVNSNPQLRYSDDAYNISKTGFINESGYCLASRLQIANQTMDIVLLQAESRQHLYQDLKKIKRWVKSMLCDKQ